MTEPSSLAPSIALAAYAEPLAVNRRVLVFGNALGSLSLQLLERGARSVHVSDPDPARVSEAAARNRSTQVSFSSLGESDLALRDGGFDLALIDDLGAFETKSIVRTVKRTLALRGVALIACPNPEASFPLLPATSTASVGIDYYALYDAVAVEFEHVRMLGQTPFVGYAIADFSASGEPEPALDTSFVPGGAEEPDSFIALASGHEVRLDEFAVIQLPTRRLLGSIAGGAASSAAAAAESGAKSKAHDAELSRQNQWIKELEGRASTADERADHAETELEELRPKLEAERQAQATSKLQHERELSALRAELSALRSQAITLRAESSKLSAESSKLSAESSALRRESSTQADDLSRLTSELTRLGAELGARDRELAERNAQVEQGGDEELAEFERQLLERGGEIRKLEHDLRIAERTGRELVRELERRRSETAVQGNAELERALAEREADLQAAAWTIESLSLRLELAGKPAGAGPGAPTTPLAREEVR